LPSHPNAVGVRRGTGDHRGVRYQTSGGGLASIGFGGGYATGCGYATGWRPRGRRRRLWQLGPIWKGKPAKTGRRKRAGENRPAKTGRRVRAGENRAVTAIRCGGSLAIALTPAPSVPKLAIPPPDRRFEVGHVETGVPAERTDAAAGRARRACDARAAYNSDWLPSVVNALLSWLPMTSVQAVAGNS